MRQLLLLAATVTLLGSSPVGATALPACRTKNIPGTIRSLERQLAKAVVAHDYRTIMRIEAPNYVYTDSDAVVTKRDDFIREYRTGSSKVKVYVRGCRGRYSSRSRDHLRGEGN